MFFQVNGQRIAITSNQIIEDRLGKSGIICVEDLIHEIFTVGPNFQYASNFLWPFKVSFSAISGLNSTNLICMLSFFNRWHVNNCWLKSFLSLHDCHIFIVLINFVVFQQ